MMKTNQFQTRQAFTLIELLVVISVIGLLAGLLFPALNMIRQRAWDTAARDICQQTALAWNALLVEQRRLPPVELFKQAGDVAELDDGDIMVLMNNRTTSLLNWWKPRHPDQSKDVRAYNDWLQEKKVNFTTYGFEFGKDAKGQQIRINDLYLERSAEQRKWGFIVPWVLRWVADAEEATVDREKLEAGTVRILLDMSGDGKITLPVELGGNVLSRTAVAWVYADDKKQKVITSW